MTELGKTEAEYLSNQEHRKEHIPFGEGLFAARESQGLTIADIAKSIHLSEDVIDAIERSDVDRLPQPAYVQGYLRTYAKHLGLAEASILEDYSIAVPHALESELHPRPVIPGGVDSDSPFVKSISIVLVILVFVAVIYGVYSYYSEIVDSRNDTEESLALALPKNETSIENPVTGPEIGSQDTFEPEDDTRNTTGEVSPRDDVLVETPAEIQTETQTETQTQTDSEDRPETIAVDNASQDIRVETQPVAAGDDVVELIAHEDTWAEVVDYNDIALLYDLVLQENTVVLRGTAPFEIFLGNAPAMEVRVNGIKIDMTKFVRSNKIAHFYVSTSDQRVVFH